MLYTALMYLLLFCVVSGSYVQNCKCGRNPEKHVVRRVVGGTNFSPHKHPWLVAIFNGGRFHCGGTLINDRYVLTAGHCVKWVNVSDLVLAFGLHNINRPNIGFLEKVKKITFHINFTSYLMHDTNDIALLELVNNVVFRENIRPICLPHPNSNYEGVDALVSGWGRTGSKRSFSEVPLEVVVKVMNKTFCLDSIIGNQFTSGMLCAYSEGRDSCQGDSGGPLIYKRKTGSYELIGIVSWGIDCAARHIPSAYTKVTNYLQWIEDKTLNAVYCAINF